MPKCKTFVLSLAFVMLACLPVLAQSGADDSTTHVQVDRDAKDILKISLDIRERGSIRASEITVEYLNVERSAEGKLVRYEKIGKPAAMSIPSIAASDDGQAVARPVMTVRLIPDANAITLSVSEKGSDATKSITLRVPPPNGTTSGTIRSIR